MIVFVGLPLLLARPTVGLAPMDISILGGFAFKVDFVWLYV